MAFLLRHCRLLACLLLFSCAAHPTACVRQLALHHIGLSDKNFAPLIFSTQMLYFDREHDHGQNVVVVNEWEFASLELLLQEFAASGTPHPLGFDFGTFRSVLQVGCRPENVQVYSPPQAKLFFEALTERTGYFRESPREKARFFLYSITTRL